MASYYNPAFESRGARQAITPAVFRGLLGSSLSALSA